MKTNELTGKALDWAVAKALGATNLRFDAVHCWWFTLNGEDRVLSQGWSAAQNWAPSVDWSHSGPINEQECISVIRCDDEYGTDKRGFTTSKRLPVWGAVIGKHGSSSIYGSQGDGWGRAYSIDEDSITYGPTPLIAAMRCYVASKLGEEIDIPKGLL